jgi:intracellular multiplication protein IcmG
MIDNNQNDEEYQFADLDVMDVDQESDLSHVKKTLDTPSFGGEPKKNILRNAIIAVAVVILAMLVYKFVGSFFSKKKAPIESTMPVQPPAPPVIQPVQEIAPMPQAPAAPSPDVSELTQKLSNMESTEQNLRSDISNLSGQLSTLNSSMSELSNKISNLNQMVSSLSNRVEQQSNQIAALIAANARPKKPPVALRRVRTQRMVYFIQAIIPGRAWLIATNGSTLTVRDGSRVPGYGTVRLIDPNQGRVVMSSGQVIRFSQQDS